MTEQILLVNPRKGRMPPGLARYWAKRGRGRRRHSNPRKRRRRHVARASAPRRRRRIAFSRRVRRANPIMRRRHHFRRRRRNPRFSMGGMKQSVVSVAVPALIGGAGAVGLDLAWGYGASYLPAQLQTGWASTAAKVAAALGIGYTLQRFAPISKTAVRSGVLGAVTVIAYQAIRDFAKQSFPAAKGLGGYADYVDYSLMADRRVGAYMPGGMAPRLGFYNPAPLLDAGVPGMGAYMPDGAGSLHGYMPDDGM